MVILDNKTRAALSLMALVLVGVFSQIGCSNGWKEREGEGREEAIFIINPIELINSFDAVLMKENVEEILAKIRSDEKFASNILTYCWISVPAQKKKQIIELIKKDEVAPLLRYKLGLFYNCGFYVPKKREMAMDCIDDSIKSGAMPAICVKFDITYNLPEFADKTISLLNGAKNEASEIIARKAYVKSLGYNIGGILSPQIEIKNAYMDGSQFAAHVLGVKAINLDDAVMAEIYLKKSRNWDCDVNNWANAKAMCFLGDVNSEKAFYYRSAKRLDPFSLKMLAKIFAEKGDLKESGVLWMLALELIDKVSKSDGESAMNVANRLSEKDEAYIIEKCNSSLANGFYENKELNGLINSTFSRDYKIPW